MFSRGRESVLAYLDIYGFDNISLEPMKEFTKSKALDHIRFI